MPSHWPCRWTLFYCNCMSRVFGQLIINLVSCQDIPCLVQNGKVVTLFAETCLWALCWARSIQSACSHPAAFRAISAMFSHLHLHLHLPFTSASSQMSLPVSWYNWNFAGISFPYAPLSPRFDRVIILSKNYKFAKLLIFHLSEASC